jgi:hypothetical protein
MVEDKIFDCIAMYRFDVELDDINKFREALCNESLPNVIIFETKEGVFKVNRKKKSFRILHRKYYPNKSLESDFVLMSMFKIALWSGYECFLESKYSN